MALLLRIVATPARQPRGMFTFAYYIASSKCRSLCFHRHIYFFHRFLVLLSAAFALFLVPVLVVFVLQELCVVLDSRAVYCSSSFYRRGTNVESATVVPEALFSRCVRSRLLSLLLTHRSPSFFTPCRHRPTHLRRCWSRPDPVCCFATCPLQDGLLYCEKYASR